MIPVMLGVTLLVFVILNMAPGDAATNMLGDYAEEAELEALRDELGLNDRCWFNGEDMYGILLPMEILEHLIVQGSR